MPAHQSIIAGDPVNSDDIHIRSTGVLEYGVHRLRRELRAGDDPLRLYYLTARQLITKGKQGALLGWSLRATPPSDFAKSGEIVYPCVSGEDKSLLTSLRTTKAKRRRL